MERHSVCAWLKEALVDIPESIVRLLCLENGEYIKYAAKDTEY